MLLDTYKDKLMNNIKVTSKTVAIESRVVRFQLSPHMTKVFAIATCDGFFQESLDKDGMDQLISGLQTLRSQMET